ncbi:AAA family ATPase [Candidatus Pacearchaeota archaeon]|nr:AAA family ATPase [Candidatus Pacearchaeota archaeon]MBD3283764.1 AAA family ATPase [Candidatus Pacearchaeota archaeon]
MLVIIRGNACSGKSTVADRLRNHFKNQSKTAVIHTTMFYWEIVHGDSPKIVMENTKRILDNYLRNKYDVILEGSTLSNKDKKGKIYLERFLRIAKKYKTPVKQFFFEADFEILKHREKKRKQISIKKLKEFYNNSNKTRKKEEIVINTSNKSINQVVNQIKKILDS